MAGKSHMQHSAESVARPWDDPTDPRPERYTPDGLFTPEFLAWVRRQGRRRWLYMGFGDPEQFDGTVAPADFPYDKKEQA